MSNIYTLVGDPHITSKSLDHGDKLFDIVESMGNRVIWLGDFLDTKEVIRGKCLNLIHKRLSESKLHHIIVIGNHDWFNLECKDHALQVLKTLKNVSIIDRPSILGSQIVALPYIHNVSELRAELDKLREIGVKSIVGHFDTIGFDYGNGHSSESGLTIDDFQGFECVISGHYHKLQRKGVLTYLGTPFSHSFGEANQDKVLGVWDAESLEIKLIPTSFPRHVSVDHTVGSPKSDAQVAEFINQNRNNKIRVRLFGKPEDVVKFNKSPYNELNIKWEDKSDGSSDSHHDVDESLDNKSQFMGWARDIKGLDQETINIGLGILEGLNVK